jgi:hypothetical protein
MEFGDVLFVTAFIVLPLVIVALSVLALRSLGRRPMLRRPTAHEFGGDTAELPIPPRDWAASIKPLRHREERVEQEIVAPKPRPFKLPAYRARSGGVVRRLNSTAPRRYVITPAPGSTNRSRQPADADAVPSNDERAPEGEESQL